MPTFAIVGLGTLAVLWLMARQPTARSAGQSPLVRGRTTATQGGAVQQGLGSLTGLLNSIFGSKPSSGNPAQGLSRSGGGGGGPSLAGAPGGGGFTQSGHQSPSNQVVDMSSSLNTPSKIGTPVGNQPDGSIMLSDGSVILPDGSTILPDGTMLDANGATVDTSLIAQSAPGDGAAVAGIVASMANVPPPALAPQVTTDGLTTAQDIGLANDFGVTPFVDPGTVDGGVDFNPDPGILVG